jgi:hypothetical protein
MDRETALKWLVILLLLLFSLLVYGPVIKHDFVLLDDNIYVTGNPHVLNGLSWKSVVWAFTTFEGGFWHPLTWLSLMLDCEIYGSWPGGYHWSNLLIHIASTLLLFLFLIRLTGCLWRSAVVSALFAFHPLHVESVAWLAERKDVLSALFWVATLSCYARYAENPCIWRYLGVALLLTLGMMSKPMLVTVPFVLLLSDWWPLHRISHPGGDHCRKIIQGEITGTATGEWSGTSFATVPLSQLLKEKIPLLGIAMIFTVLTRQAQQEVGGLSSLVVFPLAVRTANAIMFYIIYLYKMIWPLHLTVLYPYVWSWPLWQIMLSGSILLCMTVMSLYYARRFPFFIVGWIWYLVTMLPVIGTVQIGADRYTYIPFIGLFIMMVWGIPLFFPNTVRSKIGLDIAASVVLICLMIICAHQVQYWQNSLSLFQHAVKTTPNNGRAYRDLAKAYMIQGNFQDARSLLKESLKMQNDPGAHSDLGYMALRTGNYPLAEMEFRQALKIDASNAEYWNEAGCSLFGEGKVKEAIFMFSTALKINPNFHIAKNNLLNALSAKK